jgi:CheY-like chemotaxis protein
MFKTYLICDSSTIFRNHLRKIIEKEPAYILEAENGEEAIKVFEDAFSKGIEIDLVFLDFNLPALNGIAVFNHMVDYLPPKRIVFTGSKPNQIEIAEAVKVGAVNFLGKPFVQDKVLKMLNR